MVDYSRKIIPIDALHRFKLPANPPWVGKPEKLAGPIAAFETLCDYVKMLYDFKPDIAKDGFSLEDWESFLENVFLGTIKDTTEHGTSSVSQGVVQKLSKAMPKLMSSGAVVFCNAGSGGCKRQVYGDRKATNSDDRIIYCHFECKGGNEEPSPNAVQLGNWVPQDAKDETVENLKARFELHQQRAQKAALELHEEIDNRQLDALMVIYTFITGPAREAWEKASEVEKALMERSVEILFAPAAGNKKTGFRYVPWNGQSWFMSQEEEAAMEQLATTTMYGNLAKEELIDGDHVVRETFGMGRGSSQMGVLMANVGMNQETTGRKTIRDLVKPQIPMIARNMFQFQHQKYVIALKSGFAILLEDDANSWLRDTIIQQHEEDAEGAEGDEADEEEDDDTSVEMHVSGKKDEASKEDMHLREKSDPVIKDVQLSLVRAVRKIRKDMESALAKLQEIENRLNDAGRDVVFK